MRTIFFSLLGLLSMLSVSLAASDPNAMLMATSQQLLQRLQEEHANLKTKPDLVYSLAEEALFPHVDLDRMARSVVDRAAWAKASPTERKEFTNEFKALLLRTYASALTSYDNQKINFLPSRAQPNADLIEVSSQIISPGRPPVNVVYRLVNRNNEWKVFDLSIEGVSLVQSFRTQFAAFSQEGLVALTKKLAQHNSYNNNNKVQ